MDNYFIYDEIEAMRRRNDTISVQDAIVEEISNVRRTGFVTISYCVMGDHCRVYEQLVKLVVERDTVIRNQFGENLSLGDLRKGMIVDAVFSSAMTRSIPPQARAFRITVISRKDSINVTEGRVLSIDTNDNFFTTGNANDMLSQMRFVVNNETRIMDRRGNRIRLRNLRPGQMVRVEHANFQTMSIPPQTTAFNVQIL